MISLGIPRRAQFIARTTLEGTADWNREDAAREILHQASPLVVSAELQRLASLEELDDEVSSLLLARAVELDPSLGIR